MGKMNMQYYFWRFAAIALWLFVVISHLSACTPTSASVNEAGVQLANVPPEVQAMLALQDGQGTAVALSNELSAVEQSVIDAGQTVVAVEAVRTGEAHALNIAGTATAQLVQVTQTGQALVSTEVAMTQAAGTLQAQQAEATTIAGFAQATLDVMATNDQQIRDREAAQQAWADEQARLAEEHAAETARWRADVLWWLKVVFFSALAIAVAFVGIRLFVWAFKKSMNVKFANDSLVSLPNNKRNGIVETLPDGSITVHLLEGGQVGLPAPARLTVRGAVEEADETIRINNRDGTSYDILKEDPHQAALKQYRDEALWLLVASVNVAGEQATQFPTAKQLGCRSEARSDALALLKPVVYTKQGRSGGSFVDTAVVEDLGTLLECVKALEIVPWPDDCKVVGDE